MKSAVLLTAAGLLPAVVRCDYPSMPDWHPPGVDDVRAPCPMLNTLANHGFLPHDGKDITVDKTISALGTALNIDADLGKFLFDFAVTTNPDANATTFSLDNLSRHDILEHDASLSRADAYFADPQVFNQTVFDETRSYWKGDVIDLHMAAASRHARVITSATTNPNFSLSELGGQFSYGETAAYLIVFGDRVAGTAPKALVEYLFLNERLPYTLGWSKPEEAISQDVLFDMLQRVFNATGSSPEHAESMIKRGDLHAGLRVV